MNAAMFAAVDSDVDPGSSGGIVVAMRTISSRADRLRQTLRKLLPASGGASLRPPKSAMWQLAQFA
jgi:hypothetical protein